MTLNGVPKSPRDAFAKAEISLREKVMNRDLAPSSGKKTYKFAAVNEATNSLLTVLISRNSHQFSNPCVTPCVLIWPLLHFKSSAIKLIFNSLFRLTTTKTSKLWFSGPLQGKKPPTDSAHKGSLFHKSFPCHDVAILYYLAVFQHLRWCGCTFMDWIINPRLQGSHA